MTCCNLVIKIWTVPTLLFWVVTTQIFIHTCNKLWLHSICHFHTNSCLFIYVLLSFQKWPVMPLIKPLCQPQSKTRPLNIRIQLVCTYLPRSPTSPRFLICYPHRTPHVTCSSLLSVILFFFYSHTYAISLFASHLFLLCFFREQAFSFVSPAQAWASISPVSTSTRFISNWPFFLSHLPPPSTSDIFASITILTGITPFSSSSSSSSSSHLFLWSIHFYFIFYFSLLFPSLCPSFCSVFCQTTQAAQAPNAHLRCSVRITEPFLFLFPFPFLT